MLRYPLQPLPEVADVFLDRDVVYPRLEPVIEVLIVVRVLLEDERPTSEEVREAVRCHRAVNVQLVLVLRKKKNNGLVDRICCCSSSHTHAPCMFDDLHTLLSKFCGGNFRYI